MTRTLGAGEGAFLVKRRGVCREVICFKGHVCRKGKEMGLLYF